MADTLASGASGRKLVGVQISPPAGFDLDATGESGTGPRRSVFLRGPCHVRAAPFWIRTGCWYLVVRRGSILADFWAHGWAHVRFLPGGVVSCFGEPGHPRRCVTSEGIGGVPGTQRGPTGSAMRNQGIVVAGPRW